MNVIYPLVSVIMATYNRASTIERAINSVLDQTYKEFELIIIDDGSTDNTSEILNKFNDPRMRILKHPKNMGVTAAKNTGLRDIKGEWFTTFDSDDEMIPEAIETMMSIPLHFDKSVTAVTCNCFDTSENDFKGKGLFVDQYLEVETIMTSCKGDFWGLTKTSLLMNDFFNENLSGFETVLWYKIDDRAKRYYIHKPLLIVHTEGQDRISTTKYNFNKEVKLYTNLINEVDYLNKIKKYNPGYLTEICRNGLIVTRLNKDLSAAQKYYNYLNNTKKSLINDLIYNSLSFASMMKNYINFKLFISSHIKVMLK
jgi:glycosyltransferase involved in cell wall biosynthesis